jgi:hypothetical protein
MRVGTLFTYVLSNRLSAYAEKKVELSCESQTGFKADYSTVHNMLSLYCLIELSQKLRKNYIVHLFILKLHSIMCGELASEKRFYTLVSQVNVFLLLLKCTRVENQESL